MISPDPVPSIRTITMGQWASEREVDLLGRDDDLDEVIFPVLTLDWHVGEPNDEQLVDVIYKNTFTASRRMRRRLVDTLWAPDYVQLVATYVKHECSDGIIYEIKWRPHTQSLRSLLPPNGSCYTLVAAFLLREQERLDGSGSDGNQEDDDDVETDPEPVIVGAALAASAAAPSAAPSADPDDSDDGDDYVSLEKFMRARKKFKSMYESHTDDSAGGEPSTYFA